jgi:endonuclease IV
LPETILNIYLIIDKNFVTAFKCKAYEQEGSDEEKIRFLKDHAKDDFSSAFHFDAPQNKNGEFMSYKKFSKIESQGLQYKLFEEIFRKFGVPEKPLICVTPVVDSEVWAK